MPSNGGWDEESMKDFADLEINEQSDDDRIFQRFCNKKIKKSVWKKEINISHNVQTQLVLNSVLKI